jgi:atypical dual specificity phosphatase
MPAFFNKLAVYPTLYFGCFLEFIGVRKWYTRIDEHCVLGALPMKRNYKQIIAAENIKAVLTMNEDHELKYSVAVEEWQRLDIEFKQVPVTDYIGVASLDQIREGVDFINKHRDLNQTVYVHCKAGRYRSALITACYLIKKHQFTPEMAKDKLESVRSHVILDRKRQMMAMQQYYDFLYKNNNEKH